MKPGSYRRRNVKWIGNAVHHHSGGSPVLAIVPDGTWPGMWRVALPDGSLTDMVNLSRVRDAAIDWAVSWLNRSRNVPARPAVRPPIEFPALQAILWLWARREPLHGLPTLSTVTRPLTKCMHHRLPNFAPRLPMAYSLVTASRGMRRQPHHDPPSHQGQQDHRRARPDRCMVHPARWATSCTGPCFRPLPLALARPAQCSLRMPCKHASRLPYYAPSSRRCARPSPTCAVARMTSRPTGITGGDR